MNAPALWALLAVVLSAGAARADDFWREADEHDRARLRAEVAVGVSEQQLLGYGHGVDLPTGSGKSFALDGGDLGAMEAAMADLGARAYVLGPAYVGVEASAGSVFLAGARDKSTALYVQDGPRFVAGLEGVLGVRLLRRGVVQADLEALGGGRFFTLLLYRSTSTVFFGKRETYAEAIVEPRVRLDFWVSRSITLDVWGGANVLEPGEVGLGGAFVVHFGPGRRR